jgi:hypothetical protein
MDSKVLGIVGRDIMAMFKSFQDGSFPPFRLIFGNNYPPSKKDDAIQIQQYIPTCLLIVSFKNFKMVGTNRLTKVAHLVINPTKIAFMPGRHIPEGVLVLHRTIHELHREKLDGIFCKNRF